jgi:hypothetical protein
MSLLDDLDTMESDKNRNLYPYLVNEAGARIRAALIARESAQPEIREMVTKIGVMFMEYAHKLREPLNDPREEVMTIIAAALARAREADAKTIAELREDAERLYQALLYTCDLEGDTNTNASHAIKHHAALAKGKE